jgi:hypothetical protein
MRNYMLLYCGTMLLKIRRLLSKWCCYRDIANREGQNENAVVCHKEKEASKPVECTGIYSNTSKQLRRPHR